ncbi:uncharacterized protein LOC9325163 isoform X2 [Arabidopsis lyrata subsp. lyrata]|uniref:uncharacterized protein LOC9325163 isoform X2 n=1 Tax=Arabidopsis lyrata subsp. lyrata TaxID=81972 RepID=UPI000A29B234|nr:uncharacterized protein LOC9325163 isoform X2 [Arabidopsis lyrata subsp. lyrata]|eukprot:XP_020891203.1 uncharacterized protein LOC9325163 isoform X2 [Arabidopsis lyrata subsp. lyrata]
MDFHGMKRKDLQALCKKHGIPANLKNTEMANRLVSVLEKETLTDTISLSEDSVEVLEDDIVVKRVRFSPENEVFEFTRSVKKCQRKNVRTLSKGNVQDLQESGIELRRSTRIVAKGNKTVAGSNVNESTARRGRWFDVTKGLKVPRPLKRIGSSGTSQEDCKVTELMALEQDGVKFEKIGRPPTPLISKTGDLLPVKPSKLLVDIYKEAKLVKNNVKEVLQGDPKFEKVSRRSKQLVNGIDVQTNTQDQRRSIRLKARAANPSMEGESSDGRPLCYARESKEEIKTTKQSKRSTVVNSREGELVKYKAKEPLIDCKVQTTEDYRRLKVQDASKVENVPRRSKRGCNDINVLMDKRPIKAVKRDDLGVKKAPKHSRQRVKSLSERLVDGQAQKGDKQPKRTFGNDREGKKLLQTSKHTASDKMLGQALSDSLKSCSVIDCERDGVGNVKKSNVNDEMQVRVRVSRSSLRHHSFKVPIEVERNLIDEKTDETLDSLVKSSKRVTRMTKRDRSAEPGKGIETASTQSNLTPKKGLDEYIQFDQEEGGGANVESRGSSKKSKTRNQECVKDMPQGMIENSPFFSETKAAESVVMTTENVLDSTLEKSVDSSQRTNIQELNSELMEGNSEEKLERDTVSMVESAVSEHSSIEAILENSAECWKEIHPSKDGEKGSVEKEAQGANLHGNCIEYKTEKNSAEEEMEITKVGCVNLTPEKLVDQYTQLEPEEAEGVNIEARGSFKKMKTVNQESVKDKPQGMTEEASPSTSETNATEHVMISEDVLNSTLKVSGDFSPVRNTQELDSEPLDEQHEEKHEQETVLMAAIEEKEETSSLSVLQVDCGIFTTPEKHLLLETDEGVKEDNITAKSHVVNDVLAAAVPQSLMGDSEPDEAEKYREIKDVERLGESNTSTHPERQIMFGNSVLDETKDYSAATCEVAFVLTSAERQLLVNSKPYSDGKQEQKEVDDSVVQENTIVDSSGSIASKVSYNHELNAGQETAGAEDVVGLDATQGTSKKSREHSPHVDTEEAETIMEAEKNISSSSFVALPAEGNNSETIGEISSYLEVAGTCSMVSESGPSTDIQNQINDALEEWAITDNNEVDEVVEAKVTENIQKGFEGNLLLNSSGGGSNVSEETCILGETEDEDEAAVPIAIAVEKAISLTPDELTVQNHINEKAADEEMITRESTPIPEETMNESSENRKEYLNIDESATLSKRQVRREPTLIFRTQVKPTKHDMKENAPNSKSVHNLNVTAPRTSKRPPLQDLSKN